nr:hypothetical protein [Methanobrevibacter oralis]
MPLVEEFTKLELTTLTLHMAPPDLAEEFTKRELTTLTLPADITPPKNSQN